MNYKNKSVMHIAFSDMYDEIRENKEKNKNATREFQTVSPHHLCTKETRRLNRELGLSKLNYSKK